MPKFVKSLGYISTCSNLVYFMYLYTLYKITYSLLHATNNNIAFANNIKVA